MDAAYRAGSNVSASRSGNVFSFTYTTPLPSGTYATQVILHGAQNPNFSGNPMMPMLVVLTSTTTGFTFEFIDLDVGTVLAPVAGYTTATIDFVTIQQNL